MPSGLDIPPLPHPQEAEFERDIQPIVDAHLPARVDPMKVPSTAARNELIDDLADAAVDSNWDAMVYGAGYWDQPRLPSQLSSSVVKQRVNAITAGIRREHKTLRRKPIGLLRRRNSGSLGDASDRADALGRVLANWDAWIPTSGELWNREAELRDGVNRSADDDAYEDDMYEDDVYEDDTYGDGDVDFEGLYDYRADDDDDMCDDDTGCGDDDHGIS